MEYPEGNFLESFQFKVRVFGDTLRTSNSVIIGFSIPTQFGSIYKERSYYQRGEFFPLRVDLFFLFSFFFFFFFLKKRSFIGQESK